MALETVKKIELEVLHTLEELTGQREMAVEEVGPWQFLGIEVKPWAREIAELTLWIGYHQFWMEHHGHTLPPEPVLRDSGNLELRDAVLAWDEAVEDPERERADPTPSVKHPVTGELVPDPKARLSYVEYRGACPAEWPEADFIVGNPPYMGRGRQREEFGDGYVEALRAAYPDVNENSDYVMFWWHKAAQAVAKERTIRAGLITTNTITQRNNREEIVKARENGVGIVWAIADHPWIDETGSADVRVAMTVLEKDPERATLVEPATDGAIFRQIEVERVHADLTGNVDVAGAAEVPLVANGGLSSQGFTLVGQGFVLDGDEARDIIDRSEGASELIRPYLSGRDVTKRRRDQLVIDFGMMDEEEAREYPVLFDIVRSRVKPMRDSNKRAAYRQYWWRFGEPRPGFRSASQGLARYIATSETSKHRFFLFLSPEAACSHAAVVLALDDPFYLGVLSSHIHVTWTLASGGRLGVGNDPRYQKTLCFDAFPFPALEESLRKEIGKVAERLDRHRKDAMDRDERVTMTGMYNVLVKLRSQQELTEAERQIHDLAACGILKDLHEGLDELVAEAYGWSWPMETEEILNRLVRLHDQRVREEEQGKVRWLRPSFQVPRFGGEHKEADELALQLEVTGTQVAVDLGPTPWPDTTAEQIAALKTAVVNAPGTMEELAARFSGARRKLVARHLETLEIVGEIARNEDGQYQTPAPSPEIV